jgi:glycerol kinase
MTSPSPYILVLDQGTTSSRALVFNMETRDILATTQKEIATIYPQSGWVEQDASEIWETQRQVARLALEAARLTAGDLRCIGIANQRETVVVWDARTGQPLCPAIVWQIGRAHV